MKKNIRRMLAAGAAVVVLGGVYAYLLRNPKQEADAEAQVTITDLQNAELAQVEMALQSGETYAIAFRTEDDSATYTMSGGEEDAAYSENIMKTLQTDAVALTAQKIQEHCTDLSEYQLDDTSKTDVCTITDTDGNQTKLTFGLYAELVDGRYFLLGDDRETVYRMDGSEAELLTEPQSYYRDLTVLGGYYSLSGELQALRISTLSDGTTFALKRREEESADGLSDFVLTSPTQCDADDNALSNGVLYDLQYGMTANAIETEHAEDLAQYGLDNPVRVEFTLNNREASVRIGTKTEDGKEIYVMRDGTETVYRCDASNFGFLDDDWRTYRSTALFKIAQSSIASVVVDDGAKKRTVKITALPAEENENSNVDTYTGTLDGSTMTDAELSAFYLALTGMDDASVYDTAQSGKVVLSITVHTTDEKTHQIRFIKGGSREYIASVDDGGAVHSVNVSEVEAFLNTLTATAK